MDIYTAINQRRTIRDFQDKEIDMDTIIKILNAGFKAPTNDHMRNWEFVVITDPEEKANIIQKIFKTISKKKVEGILDNWNMTDEYQRAMYMDGIPKQYAMLYHSGCIILPFFKQETPLLKPKNLSSLNAFASIWCCIENIFLSATAEGLACAMRIPFAEETKYLQGVIGHPDDYVMPCYISIGYPKEDAIIPSQHDINAKDRIHMGKW